MKERETRLISIENRFSPITEQYRNVRTSIQFASSSGLWRRLFASRYER